MKRIAFVRLRYLPESETFIYGELKGIRHYKPIVFTRKRFNLRRFPHKPIKRLPHSPAKIAGAFRRKRIKLIHARFGNAGVSLLPVKRRVRIPMLTSFHGFDLPSKRNRRKSYHRKLPLLFKHGTKFTVPSRHMKRKLIRWGCPRGKIKILYSGIDLRRFPYMQRPARTDGILIIGVGRLHKKKGFKYLIKAFKLVQEKHPSSQLLIIGRGQERGRLKRLIRKLKLQSKVKLKGHVEHHQLNKWLQRADIFCLPSVTTKDGNQEGIPNSLKEAMATGLPVISTKHGGIPELIGDGQEGYLVPERSVSKLAMRICELIEQPELRLAMGERGREKVERNFNREKQVARLEEIYRRLLRKGR